MAKTKTNEEKTTNIDLTKIKKELKEYIDKSIKDEMNEEIVKANNKLIKEKNKKIFTKNITIFLLILLVGYLVYLLYTASYFDKYFTKTNTKEITNITNLNSSTVLTLEELKEKYGYLLDNINIQTSSSYLTDYYNGNLTDELKNYLVLNTISFDDLTTEEDYNIIDNDIIKDKYTKMFQSNYKTISFDYNGNKIRYINKLNAYLTTSILTKEETNIKREIIDVVVNNKEVSITTIEALVKDNKLYNILTNSEVGEYTENSLTTSQDSLNKITYVFKDNRLISINK